MFNQFNERATNVYVKTIDKFYQKTQHLKQEQSGVTAIEYGLVAVFLTIFIIVVFTSDDRFTHQLQLRFATLASYFANFQFPN
ncbi:Flp family type IVb pilin [Phocoenobacter skyensis]|uniref:Flp family type IVb pilin n=1 Tax=Phocoenobacter skyensis TaxID=97481 RepID=A0A1H8AAZ3_9PAST|nr:Flp family type IVb pilin [Pasteurella skyensis]MDP8080404.1 Flp family type IVb pilin [Pasteurella skyensis]MDP8086394.1 Flp family type IVb pilin [Pasteurella skyensis]MDP8186157.1 Flp family type IVb pilin [Pasteurella skyensis]SEM67646.1 Flp/Fap pilin component [Pasteurella skyensis]